MDSTVAISNEQRITWQPTSNIFVVYMHTSGLDTTRNTFPACYKVLICKGWPCLLLQTIPSLLLVWGASSTRSPSIPL